MITWIKPYTVREMELKFPRNLLLLISNTPSLYEIVFEESRILINMDKEQATAICAALNGAYNLGRMEEEMYENNN